MYDVATEKLILTLFRRNVYYCMTSSFILKYKQRLRILIINW